MIMMKIVSCCLCLGIDVGRFIADEQYKLETILGLAMCVLQRWKRTQIYRHTDTYRQT